MVYIWQLLQGVCKPYHTVTVKHQINPLIAVEQEMRRLEEEKRRREEQERLEEQKKRDKKKRGKEEKRSGCV